MRQVSETRWPYVLHQGRCDSLMNALSAAVGGNGLLIRGCDRQACSEWVQREGSSYWWLGLGHQLGSWTKTQLNNSCLQFCLSVWLYVCPVLSCLGLFCHVCLSSLCVCTSFCVFACHFAASVFFYFGFCRLTMWFYIKILNFYPHGRILHIKGRGGRMSWRGEARNIGREKKRNRGIETERNRGK